MVAVNKESQEKHPRNNLSPDINVFRINGEYITQVSEEIERTVTKKLSQPFSRTQSRIPSALLLVESLLNLKVLVQSGIVPESSQNFDRENQDCNEDLFQSDPDREVGTSVNTSPFCEKQLCQNTVEKYITIAPV